jgi:hypothetical protein
MSFNVVVDKIFDDHYTVTLSHPQSPGDIRTFQSGYVYARSILSKLKPGDAVKSDGFLFRVNPDNLHYFQKPENHSPVQLGANAWVFRKKDLAVKITSCTLYGDDRSKPITKSIKYFNISFEVCSTVNYISIDESGGLFGYQDPPVRKEHSWSPEPDSPSYLALGKVSFEGSWEESCLKV